MTLLRLAYLAGPLAVRDLVGGVGGVAVAVLAFLGGCALASAFNLAWFALIGGLGVASLATSAPTLLSVRHLVRGAVIPDADVVPLRAAA